MKNKTLGQKIAYYRKRAGLSQLQLELEIEAGQGSISRIENGQVNPTKETLGKIARILNLSSNEIAELHGFRIKEIPHIIRLMNRISDNLGHRNLNDIIVSSIIDDLNLSGVVLFETDDDFLHAVAIDDSPPGISILLKMLGLEKFHLKIPLSSKSRNLCLKCIREGIPMQSYDAYDFTVDVMGLKQTRFIEKITSFKSGIVFPLKYNNKIIGAIMFMKSIADNFESDFEVLNTFTEYMATSMNNVNKLQLLTAELEKLKNEK